MNSRRNALLVCGGVLSVVGTCYALLAREESSLTPNDFRQFNIVSIIKHSQSSSVFRIAAETDTTLPSGIYHVVVKDDSCQIARPYTPIRTSRGELDLLVKRYDQGTVSRYIHSLRVSDSIHLRGPLTTMPYTANSYDSIGMVVGGTGIAPAYQLATTILTDPQDKTRISIVYASRNEQEVLLTDELQSLVKQYPDRLQVTYRIDESFNPNSIFTVGRIDGQTLVDSMPSWRSKCKIIVCGPDG